MKKKHNILVGPTGDPSGKKEFYPFLLARSLWKSFNALDFFTRFFVLIVILFAIFSLYNIFNPIKDTRTRAEELTPTPVVGKTASIVTTPSTGSYTEGQVFNIDVQIDGGGQTFNAAKATIAISSNLQINGLSVVPLSSGGCNFTWANNKSTPTVNNPSFSGAILKNYSLGCKVYTLTLRALSSGTGVVTISKGSVISYSDHKDILDFVQNGSYLILSATTSTTIPTVTVTPTPTAVPTNSPTPIPTNTPTPTVVLSPSPTPTPVVLLAPDINNQPTDTYDSEVTLSGNRVIELTTVFINDSSAGLIYPTSTTWSSPKALVVGANTFEVYGKDSVGNKSMSNFVSIVRHNLGDISGDGIIDLTDLSMFASDFENAGSLNYNLSDMNKDGLVDLFDFSIIAKQYNGS